MSKSKELIGTSEINDLHQLPITEEEIIEALRHISQYKAQGCDNIHNSMVKNGGNTLIQSLLFLFDWSFQIGYMPKIWKCANIVPIPKPDRDHSYCKNYRPIALLSCVGKLLERIITKRLIWYINQNDMLTYTQAGFQSWHNTGELILRLTENIYKTLDLNSVTYAVMLDICCL